MILHFVRMLSLIEKLFVGFIIFENILETFGNFPKDKGINLTLLVSCRGTGLRGDGVPELLRLVTSSWELLVWLACLVSVRLAGALVSILVVQPFESNNQFLGQSEILSLKKFDALFVFG